MAFDRRQFLKTTIAGTATLAIGGCNTFASTETKAGSIAGKAQLNISFQEGTAPGATLQEKFDFMEEHNVVGFEPHGKPLLQRKDRKSTRLNSSHVRISYAVFCLKKKNKNT